jgi:predicted SAM-dependent methyltransferase
MQSPQIQPQVGQVKKLLHVGCGQKRKKDLPKMFQGDDWQEIRLDISPNVQPDIVADIMDMSPVADESVEAVFSSHNIEHVYIHQVQTVLKEFYRVVRVGGAAFITCPDLQAIAFAIAQGNLEGKLYESPAGIITPLDIFYGHTASIARGEHYMAHKCGFTAETLGRRMQAAGFRDVIVERDKDYNLWARGTKLPMGARGIEDDKITLKGQYAMTVVNIPDIVAGHSVDELDLPPKMWKPLGLKQA